MASVPPIDQKSKQPQPGCSGRNLPGKDTVWVNIGTLIRSIIDDLRTNQPDLWTEMAAVLV